MGRINIEIEGLDNVILIGDRILIKPLSHEDRTKSGLYLPPGVQENEPVQCGYIIKVGPGYPIPSFTSVDDNWKPKHEKLQYISLQAEEGDLAIYLQNNSWELEMSGKKYVIISHSSILMLVRNSDLFT